MFWITGGGGLIVGLHTLFGGRLLEALAKQMHHCPWNGFHWEDFIFPLFVFIVGLSIPFSLGKRREEGPEKLKLYKRIFRRTLLLYVLGFIYSNGLAFGEPLSQLRVLGVLQRISICYCFASLAVLWWNPKGQGLFCFALLALYWVIMKYVPVPGVGPGVLEPDKNMSNYLDSLLLPGKLYHDTWDPEGLLSTLPAVSGCLLGAFTGQWIRSTLSDARKIQGLLLGGGLGVLLGVVLHHWFPINKPIWSPSFVLLTAGLGAILFAFFFWIMDVKGYTKWAFFFLVIGSNSIFIYMLQDMFSWGSGLNELAGDQIFGFLGNGRDFTIEVIDVACKWMVLYLLYRKKVFIRV